MKITRDTLTNLPKITKRDAYALWSAVCKSGGNVPYTERLKSDLYKLLSDEERDYFRELYGF